MGCYVPPTNFGYVEEGLHRSGIPGMLNLPFLEKLQLKKVIYLANEPPPQEFCTFLDEQGIQIHTLGTDNRQSLRNHWDPISEEVVIQALKLILDLNNYPLLVMCSQGRHQTGTVIGCLRKLQRWNLASVFDEYRRYAGSKVHLVNEQFIELFDTDLVPIPAVHPHWL
eukprot:TRINITY_DN4905_c4_g1_i1.p1 TRINITY_DN4905_c4_g1~~TRINITY_DN4905_c4_g1_i1.p1  ORF type:complete len:168 (-),score=49.42 TRINITY_DN4905_c4_g1_i1:69-572(-)